MRILNLALCEDQFLNLRTELEIRDKNRLETFVDGVFAVAITLLVLDFVIPALPHSQNVAILTYLSSLSLKFLG